MGNTEITIKSYKIIKDEHGIIHKTILKDTHIELADAKESEELAIAMNGSKDMLAIVDATEFYTMSAEATEYIQHAHLNNRIATAIVSASLGDKILTDHFARAGSMLKVFTSKGEAIEWLLAKK